MSQYVARVSNYLILWKSHFYSIKTDKWVLHFSFIPDCSWTFALQFYNFSSNEVMAKQYEALLTYKINRCDHRRPTTISNNSKVIALFSFYLLIRFVFCPRHVYFRPSWIWYIKRSSSIKHIILMFSCTMYTYMIDLFTLPVPYYYISVEHNYWLAINNQILKLNRIIRYLFLVFWLSDICLWKILI